MWKDVVGYEGLYQISDCNEWVKSLNYNHTWMEKILNPGIRSWYLFVGLCNNSKSKLLSIHRLVAIAFIPNPENKPEVNHKDWNKLNNNLDNIEWCTRSENSIHAYKMWLRETNNFKVKHPSKWKLWKNHFLSKKVNQYDLKWNLIKEWGSMSDVKRELWIYVYYCCSWRLKTAGGFIWRYS